MIYGSGTSSTSANGDWYYQQPPTPVTTTCRGSCGRELRINCALHDLASAQARIPPGMMIIEKAGRVLGVMCPDCTRS